MDESFLLFSKTTLITGNFPHINIFPSFFLCLFSSLFLTPASPSHPYPSSAPSSSHQSQEKNEIFIFFPPSLNRNEESKQTIYVIFCFLPSLLSRWGLAGWGRWFPRWNGESTWGRMDHKHILLFFLFATFVKRHINTHKITAKKKSSTQNISILRRMISNKNISIQIMFH